jgi:hypothetical protein
VRWLLIVCSLAAADEPRRPAPQDVIDGLKSIERELGFEHRGNFREPTTKPAADYRCYYTGKLELPDSYEGLRLERGTENGCRVNVLKYDVFFYKIEAVANGEAPVTAALAEAPVERMSVVVPHEDFHDHEDVRRLPETVSEAAATLIGFLTAAEYARRQYGENAELYRGLAGEADLFLRKAEVVNAYHGKLRDLYRSGGKRREALARKEELFSELRAACQAIAPDPRSFNKCPAANNNAGLAFDATYTRYYPLLHRVYVALGRDLKATADAIRSARASSEPEAVRHFEELIRSASTRSVE